MSEDHEHNITLAQPAGLRGLADWLEERGDVPLQVQHLRLCADELERLRALVEKTKRDYQVISDDAVASIKHALDETESAETERDELRATVARVEALLPEWFAEPSDCGDKRTCNLADNPCGASSCFATHLKDVLEGSTTWRYAGDKLQVAIDEAERATQQSEIL